VERASHGDQAARGVVERSRRQADVEAPPLIDVYPELRTLYLHIASVEASVPIVTITGDDQASWRQLRPTGGFRCLRGEKHAARRRRSDTCSVASRVRVRPGPGLSGIITGQLNLARGIVPTTIGRDRPLDVLPSGTRRSGLPERNVVEEVKKNSLECRTLRFHHYRRSTSYVQRSASRS